MTTNRTDIEGADDRHDSGEFPRPPLAMVAPIAPPPPWEAGGVSGKAATVVIVDDPLELPRIGRGSTEGVYAIGNLARAAQSVGRWYEPPRPVSAIPAQEEDLPACFGAEPFLLSARLDLMGAADMRSAQLRDIVKFSFLAEHEDEIMSGSADLIDRLAAYLKGGDVRLIAAGREVESLRSNVREAQGIYQEQAVTIDDLRALIRAACPAVRLVARLAGMTDIEADFVEGLDLRSTARAALNGEPFAIPVLYSDEDRKRASDAIFVRFYVQSVATSTGELVDLVAEALGMRRAGA